MFELSIWRVQCRRAGPGGRHPRAAGAGGAGPGRGAVREEGRGALARASPRPAPLPASSCPPSRPHLSANARSTPNSDGHPRVTDPFASSCPTCATALPHARRAAKCSADSGRCVATLAGGATPVRGRRLDAQSWARSTACTLPGNRGRRHRRRQAARRHPPGHTFGLHMRRARHPPGVGQARGRAGRHHHPPGPGLLRGVGRGQARSRSCPELCGPPPAAPARRCPLGRGRRRPGHLPRARPPAPRLARVLRHLHGAHRVGRAGRAAPAARGRRRAAACACPRSSKRSTTWSTRRRWSPVLPPLVQGALRRAQQECMIGYSDSGKDAGRLAAAWGAVRGPGELDGRRRQARRAPDPFPRPGRHRGAGRRPTHLAILSQPPGTISGRIRVTVQGEVVEQQLGETEMLLPHDGPVHGAVSRRPSTRPRRRRPSSARPWPTCRPPPATRLPRRRARRPPLLDFFQAADARQRAGQR